ncbi:MAG: hypothetical protein CMO30_14595 [Tistrella sp.]|uniref:DNA -binding domain-containing protein n=1 Tax=Tistrella sp. TaxID=2024861 RepID=UPI000C38791A|nr:DUF2285 domain-containing protein [Tistrella sp.]MAD40344.1 hypothetical protein [Tistrella sp.]MBA76498.1 hypothetical protein [Tistrella sp.]
MEDFRRAISAYVRHGGDPGLGSVVSLAKVRCRKTLLKAVDGEQHLLLSGRHRVVQIRCIGADIRVEPFVLEPVVDQFPDVEHPQRLIRRLADLYRNRLIGGPQGGWTVEAMRHRDALIAVDLRRRHWLFQDIARFIHGDEFVDEEWTNPNATLKNRTTRAYKRGRRYINGDYRKLLR